MYSKATQKNLFSCSNKILFLNTWKTCIQTLKNEFDCSVGYSGHESMGYLICVSAVLLGATSIERHITLDRSMYGSDQAASLEPQGLERLVRDIRTIDKIIGDGEKRIWPSEIPVMKKLRNLD